MAEWPASLPLPLIEGYTLQPFDNCSRVQMDSGHMRVRMEFEGDKDFLTVNWLMTNDQLTAFRDWYKNTIADGTDWFDAQMDYDGEGLKAVEARFAGKWALRTEPPHRWRVSAKLEIKYLAETDLAAENILRGLFDRDVVLLWSPTTQADVLVSKVGPDASFASTGAQYDEAGVSLGTVAALHSKGVWVGPAYSNLFTGSVAEQTKTLTAQKYTVWCDAGSVVCGAYGTATAAAPLAFTATAGSCTFTPSGVTRWMLTASVAPMPYVAPGVSVASAAGSTTNGLAWPMSAEMTAALSGRCTVAALVTMGVASGDLLGRGSGIPVLHASNHMLQYAGHASVEANSRSSIGYDGVTYAWGPIGIWSRGERHIKVLQTNALGTQFRVGNKRIGIDSTIQWSSWATYDGSFNPLTHLSAAYGNTVPLWLKTVMVSQTGGLTDSQIEERVYA